MPPGDSGSTFARLPTLTSVPAAVALTAAIVDHAVKNVVTVVGGVASTLLFNVSLTEAVEESREVGEATARE